MERNPLEGPGVGGCPPHGWAINHPANRPAQVVIAETTSLSPEGPVVLASVSEEPVAVAPDEPVASVEPVQTTAVEPDGGTE